MKRLEEAGFRDDEIARIHSPIGLGKVSGIDTNTSAQLLSALAPVVLGAVGKAQQTQQLDTNGVANLLQQERDETEQNLGGLAQMLDLDGDGDITDDLSVLGSSLLGS